jgi:hypothetical protein
MMSSRDVGFAYLAREVYLILACAELPSTIECGVDVALQLLRLGEGRETLHLCDVGSKRADSPVSIIRKFGAFVLVRSPSQGYTNIVYRIRVSALSLTISGARAGRRALMDTLSA